MMTVEARKLAVKSVFAVCVFGTLFFLVILPKAGNVRRLAVDVRVTLADNQKLQTSVLTAKHAGDRLDEIKGILAQYKTKALYQEDLTRVLDEMGLAAQTARLKVVSLRALDEPRRIPGDPFIEGAFEIQQVRVSFKAEGQYPDMVQYLKALERLTYSVDVQTVRLKSAELGSASAGEDPPLSVEVILAVLMRVPPMEKA